MKKKLLISGLGGSLFPYLHEKLSKDFEVYYVDGDNNLRYLYNDLNFIPAPWVNSREYVPFIADIIIKYGIDFYIPLIDEEILPAKAMSLPAQVSVLSPDISFSRLCLDKYALMQYLAEEDISHIRSFRGDFFSWEIPAPLFAKPISGRGSRGIRKIETPAQLDAYYLLEAYPKNDILIQEYISGIEYTVGVLTNNLNDLISISSKKVIRKKGITQIAVTEDNQLIEDIVRKIVERMKPCGPFNVQLYLTPENDVKIFEINPRFSTTTIMSYEGGVNEIKEYIEYFNKPYEQEIMRPKRGIFLHRRWENCFYEK